MMEVTTNRIDDENVELEIIVPREEVDSAVNKTFQKISSGQKIKGFRQGKVPRDVMRNMMGAEAIAAQALSELLPEVYEQAVEKAGIVPIDEPDFDPFPTLVEGQPLNVKVKLQTLPDFTVFDYSMIPVQLNRKVEIEDKEVDETVEAIRKKQAEFLPLIEDRGCVDTDRVTLNYAIDIVGADGALERSDEKEDLAILLGEGQLLPDIEKNIIGMKPGESREFNVKYPDEYQNEKLAAQSCKISISLKKIERRQLPEINEDFLKKSGGFNSLEDMKVDLNGKILSYKRSMNEQNAMREMVQRVIDGTHLEVPRKLVMEEVESRKEYIKSALANQGRDFEEWLAEQGKTEESLEEEEYHDSRMTVKRRIVLNKIFIQEKMQLSPNELEISFLQYAQENELAPADLKKMARNRGFMMHIREQTRDRKVLRFLSSRVRFMDDPDEPEVAPEEQKVESKTDNDSVGASAAD
jgi:trigger factor